jgi:predicted SpoU family rRNA methylase
MGPSIPGFTRGHRYIRNKRTAADLAATPKMLSSATVLIQINRHPLLVHNVQRRTVRLCEEMSDGRR